MGFLTEHCSFHLLTRNIIATCQPFSCGNADLDEFFLKDSPLYTENLLGKTYCYLLDEDPTIIVCAFTLSNDSVRVDHLPNSRKRKINDDIPREKQMRRYPAVLLGRLGVNKNFAGKGVGTELMLFIKRWFVQPDNKTGCRYLVVDSYNQLSTLRYYEKNGFHYLFSTEEQESENARLPLPLKTRYMYFDLIDIVRG
ncbi:MAG: GNAT family N-acetyltransferase [Bacteroidaceae bacterium]|nr:GNAT family N-acetyltransferase [Bacteroidaceae bacterium]